MRYKVVGFERAGYYLPFDKREDAQRYLNQLSVRKPEDIYILFPVEVELKAKQVHSTHCNYCDKPLNYQEGHVFTLSHHQGHVEEPIGEWCSQECMFFDIAARAGIHIPER